MPKSNGTRPVNKTDGAKDKAKKQMTKSRRTDSKIRITKAERAAALKTLEANNNIIRPLDFKHSEETIVEQVLNARNLVITNTEPVSEAPVFAETALGKIRIEGEVTPAKIAAAENFSKIFAQATEEILDLAAYTPNPHTLAFVKSSSLTEEQTQEMLRAKPWSVFQVDGKGLMKTPDNKLESVEAYVYRLERAVIDVARAKNTEIERLDAAFKTLKRKCDTLEKANNKLYDQVHSTPIQRLVLQISELVGRVKAFAIKLISK